MGLAKTAARLIAAELLYAASGAVRFGSGLVSGVLTRGADRLYGVAALAPVEQVTEVEDEGTVVTRSASELYAVPEPEREEIPPPPLEGSIEHRALGDARRRGVR